jgi:2-polyprenyl-3-methyl-5-hydroxy-6-metoxy-1,4-benzoquinol methylase
MSKENELTVKVYEKYANRYLETSSIHDSIDPEKAKRKAEKLNKFLEKSFSNLPKDAKIFEIGSGDGTNIEYLSRLGFNVTGSDIADAFISSIKSKVNNVVRFNILTDNFKEKYNGIFAWRVLVHFTSDDLLKVLEKTYNALEENGIFIFNVINRQTTNVDSEFVDFSNEYNLGAERYYHYFKQDEVDDLIYKTNYRILNFFTQGGDNDNKWLVYVLKK